MLRVDDLHVGYGDIEVVRGVSIDVEAGAAVALIGSNGAGKSTFLRAVCGLHPVTDGEVTFGGRSIVGVPAFRTARAGLAFVPSDRRLFPDMTVADNLAMGAYPARPSRARRDEVVALFPRLQERQRQLAGTMSGGEQQMLAIGRALMSGPKLLVLDEPSTGLAPVLAREVYAALTSLRRDRQVAVLLAEQQVPLAFDLVDHAVVIERGQVELEGTPAELRDHPGVQRAYLGGR